MMSNVLIQYKKCYNTCELLTEELKQNGPLELLFSSFSMMNASIQEHKIWNVNALIRSSVHQHEMLDYRSKRFYFKTLKFTIKPVYQQLLNKKLLFVPINYE